MWANDHAAALNTYGPINGWGVSSITDMSWLFRGLQTFNEDISSWDTSSVTSMHGMLQGASAFNQPLSLDTSSVTDMGWMFKEATAFNQPLSLDTFSATNMHYMFMGASAFNQPLLLDTTSVTKMRGMFRGASAFNQPLPFETSSVTDMSQMFYQASAFNQPLSFDTSGIVTDIQATCGGQPCPYSGMSGTFGGTSALSDANKLLIRCAWAGESAFDAEYGSSWVSGTCPPPPAPPSAPPLSPPPSFANDGSLGTAVQMWVNDRATALSTYGPISGWGVSAITDMRGLFSGLSNFNEDIGSWDTSRVTNMYGMFQVHPPPACRGGPSIHRFRPHALA